MTDFQNKTIVRKPTKYENRTKTAYGIRSEDRLDLLLYDAVGNDAAGLLHPLLGHDLLAPDVLWYDLAATVDQTILS